MMHDQETIFSREEGDAWFRRNAAALNQKSVTDPAISLLQSLTSDQMRSIRSVCDVGCADGWRLRALHSLLPRDAELCGFDVSQSAIDSGLKNAPTLDLRCGLVDRPPFKKSFNLVIVSFVLHWVSRNRLIRAIAAIDELVAEGGFLIIGDFLPDRPSRRRYHHREDVDLFTYKQDYITSFTGLALYRELSRVSSPHDRIADGAAPAADQDRAAYALLYKSPDAYPLI